MYTSQIIGISMSIVHRPVIVKRVVFGLKGGWKLSTIFLSCKVFHDCKYIVFIGRVHLCCTFETTSHCFCSLNLLVWLRKKDLAFWYFFS